MEPILYYVCCDHLCSNIPTNRLMSVPVLVLVSVSVFPHDLLRELVLRSMLLNREKSQKRDLPARSCSTQAWRLKRRASLSSKCSRRIKQRVHLSRNSTGSHNARTSAPCCCASISDEVPAERISLRPMKR